MFNVELQTTAEAVAIGTNALFISNIDAIKKRVFKTLRLRGYCEADLQHLEGDFDDFQLPFDGLVTDYDRKKFIKENYLYVVRLIYFRMPLQY